MSPLEVLSILPTSEADQERIRAVDPRINLVDAGGWFDGEMRESWPEFTVRRYMGPPRTVTSTREDRDQLLNVAEVIFGGFPFPLDLRARSPKLKWFHQRPAGASNLRRGDLWQSDVLVTTSRGFVESRPIAEYVVSAFMHFARGLHRAYADRREQRFNHTTYQPVLLRGKTVCVIGAGGIGRDVGAMCAALGMRVVGTRRNVGASDSLPPGFAALSAPRELPRLLAESEFVAVCCQWTDETTNLLDHAAFAAMKPGTVLANVARGEIIDEPALLNALAEGTLRGVALDVYVGEFEHAPPEALWNDDRVIITPHTSGGTDVARHRAVDVFIENLRAYLNGRPMKNQIDWDVGY
ncbi:MAG: D-2-hydroxyacid dehydrogenase [Pseudomonadota bacterium]